uniref:50S ribosomal protein L10 n=1 Tax=Rhodosorus marinus TaxID=101924 RepID=A0A7S2ZKW5_9RHOD|mmetsp:Transcript_23205/g.92596  ORF Transcript_23205/g.92596 Transcript_23205/m.92596 type:complete len:144 (+) Transcript_23205:204-635(+)
MEGVGFVGGGLALGSRPSAAAARCGRTTVSMGAESVKNRNRRVGIVDKVREQLDKSTLAFALPLEGYTVKEVSELRNVIPENSCALAVKNTLFRIAIADSTWDVAGDLTKGSNLWIFTEEADMKGTVSTLAQSFWNATAICPF